jgi:protein gp37
VRGCSRVSEGCRNCYAERQAARFAQPGSSYAEVMERSEANPEGPFHAFVRIFHGHPQWTGRIELVEKHLEDPLHWKQPRRIFVNSMSDLFHEALPDEAIDRVFAVMALCPQHTFQVLTKRPKRMLEWFERGGPRKSDIPQFDFAGCAVNTFARRLLIDRKELPEDEFTEENNPWIERLPWLHASGPMLMWPLSNVWLGVSVEDQKTADERIPLLLQTPAAVRFVSYEPALGPVDFSRFIFPRCMNCDALLQPARGGREIGIDASLPCGCKYCWHCADNRGRHEDHDSLPPHGSPIVDWIIVGGESGPGARPFDIAWARKTIAQCKATGTACFVKQLGAHVVQDGERRKKADKKGGDMHEWPHDVRVRQFPNEREFLRGRAL